MAVIHSNNRILRAGEGQGNTYFPGDYIDINENNVISFTGDFSGLSAKVDECCSAVNEEISGIKDDLSGLSGQMEDCCSSVNQYIDDLWSAVNENSANIQINSADITQLSSLVNNKLDASYFNNFYSAYNVTIDELYNHDNYLSGIIDQKLDKSAYHEYSAGDNISIADYVVSGKDWTPTIESAVSSISGEVVPWISGWSEMGNVTAEWGQSFRVVSSHDFSGYRNHSIGVKGSWITLPTTANIASALANKLDISSFNGFISNEYSTAKNDILNQIYSKQDKSGMSAYVPYSAISGSDNIITGINGSALSAGLTYTAGPNIKITDNEISGKDWTSEISDASANAVNEAINNITAVSFANSASAITTSAGWDVQEYSADANINITNHKISGKDWTDDITAASSYAYEQATASIPEVQEYSAGANIDITNHVISGKDWSDEIAAAAGGITAVQSALTANFAFSSNSATYDSDGNVITATYLSSLPEGLVSSVNNLTPSIVSGGINGSELKLSGAWPSGLQLSGQDPIQVTKSNNKVVISITGDVGKTYNVIGGTNINVATAGGTAFTVSGKSWTNDIAAASSYAYNQATANAKGKIYTGIDPIVVDNSTTTGSISAKMAILSAESPITLESSTVGNYVVNTIKYTGDAYSPVVSAMYMTTGYPSANITPPASLRQLRITTPYTYTGPSYYSAKIDGQELVMDSGAYYDFNWAVTENGIKWVVCCSGHYSLFI